MIRKTLFALLVCAAPLAHSATALVKLPHGDVVMIMDHGVSCSGQPIAMIINPQGQRVYDTCNVRITPKGVYTRFAAFPDEQLWRPDEMEFLP